MIFPNDIQIRKSRNVVIIRGAHHFTNDQRRHESIAHYSYWNAFAFMRISKVQHIRYCDLQYKDFEGYYNAAVIPVYNDIVNNIHKGYVRQGFDETSADKLVTNYLSTLTYNEMQAYLMPKVTDIIQDEDFDTREIVTVVEFNPLFVPTEVGQKVKHGNGTYTVKSFRVAKRFESGEIEEYEGKDIHDVLNSLFALKYNLDLKDVCVRMEEGCMGLIECYELIEK